MGNTARAFLSIDDDVSEPTVFTSMRQHDNDIIGQFDTCMRFSNLLILMYMRDSIECMVQNHNLFNKLKNETNTQRQNSPYLCRDQRT